MWLHRLVLDKLVPSFHAVLSNAKSKILSNPFKQQQMCLFVILVVY